MTDFKANDYVEMTTPYFANNKGIRAQIKEVGDGRISFVVTYAPEGSHYGAGEEGATSSDKWTLTDGPVPLTEADKKLAKVVAYIRGNVTLDPYPLYEDNEGVAGGIIARAELAQEILDILEG